MKTKSLMSVIAVSAMTLLHMAPASAQVKALSQYVDAYGGALIGDDLVEGRTTGRKPELEDEATFGARYGYNFTSAWGLEASIGFSPSKTTQAFGPNVDLDLWVFDIDGVYNFDTGTRFVPYVLTGLGYAKSDLGREVTLVVNGQSATIGDSDGFSANAGVGIKLFATELLFFRIEGRYRYLDKVVNRFDDSLNTAEGTLGVGWQF
jgi:opacity protein-like surface antigen